MPDAGTGFTPISLSDNPFDPTYPGSGPGGLYSIFIAGGTVYGGLVNGVVAHDISDPNQVVELGSTGASLGVTTDIDVIGNVGFFTAQRGFAVFDASDPSQMRVMATYPLTQQALDVEIVGGRAYVAVTRAPAAEPGAILVFDVSAFLGGARPDGGTIPLVSRIDTPGSPAEVVVRGSYAYVAQANQYFPDRAGLSIIDLDATGDAGTPGRVVGSWHPASGELSDVVLFGDHAIVSDTQVDHNSNAVDGMLRVVDVSNPASPAELPALQTPTFYSPYSLLIDGNRLYVTTARATEVFDVSDFAAGAALPEAPRSIALLGTDPAGNQAAIAGGYLYTAGSSVSTARNFRRQDLAELGAPGAVARLTYGRPTEVSANHIALSGGFAYVAYGPAIEIYDVRDPKSPARVAGGVIAGTAYDLSVAGNRLHVSRFLDGLFDYDVSSPTAPVLLGNIAPPGSAYMNAVASMGSFAVVSQGGDPAHSGVQLYDTTNGAAIVPPSGGAGGYLAALGTVVPNRVVLDGARAFVLERTAVRIVDLASPASPVVLGTIDFANPNAAAVTGDRLYVVGNGPFGGQTAARDGLVIYDVSTPASPREVGSLAITASASISVDGGFAYLAGGRTADVLIVDVRDESTLYVAGSYQSGDAVTELVARDNVIYAAAFLAGFEVVRWTPATLGPATETPSRGAMLTFPFSWDADMTDLHQGCTASAGACAVTGADRAANRATVTWTLPDAAGDATLVAYVGNSTLTTSARVVVSVP